jgi:hypothetical protein
MSDDHKPVLHNSLVYYLILYQLTRVKPWRGKVLAAFSLGFVAFTGTSPKMWLRGYRS